MSTTEFYAHLKPHELEMIGAAYCGHVETPFGRYELWRNGRGEHHWHRLQPAGPEMFSHAYDSVALALGYPAQLGVDVSRDWRAAEKAPSTLPLRPRQVQRGQMLGEYRVVKVTPRTVAVILPCEVDLGPKLAGKRFTYRWNEEKAAFVRQGGALFPDGIRPLAA